MTTSVQVVPGKAQLNGIRDISIPDYTPVEPSTPIHLPVIHQVMPKGELGTKFISLSHLTARYGNVFTDSSLYYNPNSVLLKQLALGGQGRVGIRRLTANTVVSRIPLSAYVQKKKINDYERTSTGQFKLDADGNRISLGEVDGLHISIKVDDTAATTKPGALEVREIVGATADDPTTYVYPLGEFPAGVGDAYNKNGINFGVYGNSQTQQFISRFVTATGVYPLSLRMFEVDTNGNRIYSNTATGGDTAYATLFDAEYNDTKYSMKRAVQSFTCRITNTVTELRPTPFQEPILYKDNIELIAQLLYSVEKPVNQNLIDNGAYSYRQMNPFTCKDHLGVPYYGIETDVVVQWDMSYAVMSQFGISPFLTDEGKVPDYVTPNTVNDPFGLLTGIELPMTPKQAW